MHTHEIPTHLQVEDRLLAGLTVRQLFPMAVAAALCYWLWRHAGLTMMPRSLLCAATVPLGVACGLVRPGGEALLGWLGHLAAYALAPRTAVWRRDPEPITTHSPFLHDAHRGRRMPRAHSCLAPRRGESS
jgi:hypothetical protein